MPYVSLSDEKKKIIFEKVLPVLEGWSLIDIYEATEYLKAAACNCGPLKLPENQKAMESNNEGHVTKLYGF